ncbi:DNA adenine methylase [bacterium]|nr:DNA adenine methylase [bacterium]
MKALLRYPGGKSRKAAKHLILSAMPATFEEYREPFFGGGGIGLTIPKTKNRWFNDLNEDLIALYERLQQDRDSFLEECRHILPLKAYGKKGSLEYETGKAKLKQFFHRCIRQDPDISTALRFLFLNRVGFSGRVVSDSTYFSAPERWNIIGTDVPEQVSTQLQGARLTCLDFARLFEKEGEGVWIYADPPYVSDSRRPFGSRLYEKTFSMDDHARLRTAVSKCNHKVLLSYDDDPAVREMYKGYWMRAITWTHCVSKKRSPGRELLIANYEPLIAATQEGEGQVFRIRKAA